MIIDDVNYGYNFGLAISYKAVVFNQIFKLSPYMMYYSEYQNEPEYTVVYVPNAAPSDSVSHNETMESKEYYTFGFGVTYDTGSPWSFTFSISGLFFSRLEFYHTAIKPFSTEFKVEQYFS
jgi:hypothetical protein